MENQSDLTCFSVEYDTDLYAKPLNAGVTGYLRDVGDDV